MTLLSRSQGRGCASTESSVPALDISAVAEEAGEARCGTPASEAVSYGQLSSWQSPGSRQLSIFDDCPLCGKHPVEPVFCGGQMACRSCTGTCTICGQTCIPGDDACNQCLQHLHIAHTVVSAA